MKPPEGLMISMAESDDVVLEFAELKAMDDAECTERPLNQARALECVCSFLRQEMDLWLARLQEVPVAYWLGQQDRYTYRSQGIYVRPEHRRQGIGLALKESQIALAKLRGCKDFVSTVRYCNTASIELQKKLGATLEPANTGGGPCHDGYIVRLSLQTD